MVWCVLVAETMLPGEEEARQRRAGLLDIKVPPRYRNASVSHPEIRDWVEGYLRGERNPLYICGTVGTGKTYQAWAAFSAVLALSPVPPRESRGWSVPEWLSACRPGGSETAEQEASKAGLLLLDDLGAHKPSEWADERLFSLLDSRYVNLRPSIFTSNLPPGEISGVLGERIASRLADGTVVVPLLGDDRRRPTPSR